MSDDKGFENSNCPIYRVHFRILRWLGLSMQKKYIKRVLNTTILAEDLLHGKISGIIICSLIMLVEQKIVFYFQ